MLIRNANPTDIDDLMILWQEFMSFHLPYEPAFVLNDESTRDYRAHVENALNNPTWYIAVAERSGVVVGFGSATIVEAGAVFGRRKYGYIDDVVVSERMRGQGTGQKLSEALMEWCKAQGAQEVQLRIVVNNLTAAKFWRHLGFSDYMLTLKKIL
jgi:GNAT superfamily N-acetyltransferase